MKLIEYAEAKQSLPEMMESKVPGRLATHARQLRFSLSSGVFAKWGINESHLLPAACGLDDGFFAGPHCRVSGCIPPIIGTRVTHRQ